MPSLDAALRRWEQEEHRFLTLAAEVDRAAAFLTEANQLNVAALLETARRDVRESRECVAALLEDDDA